MMRFWRERLQGIDFSDVGSEMWLGRKFWSKDMGDCQAVISCVGDKASCGDGFTTTFFYVFYNRMNGNIVNELN